MTILQRIELHKQGYTKEEINALVEEERAAVAQQEPQQATPAPVQQEPQQATPAPAAENPADKLLDAINNLTNALTMKNIIEKEQPHSSGPETASDVLNNILKG